MLFTKKSTLYASCLLGLTSLSAQSALASSSYSSFAEIQYTISATNRNSSGSLVDLDISDFIDAYAGAESLTSTYLPTYTPYSGLNISHTNSLSTQDSINNGTATSEYYADAELDFTNLSSNSGDIFDITVDYSYKLSAKALGEYASTDISIDAYNGNDASIDYQALSTSTNVLPGFDELTGSNQYSFTLSANQSETMYLDSFIGGYLEASTAPAPVPLPAAFWMFGSALMVFPSIRKLHKKSYRFFKIIS